MNTPNPLIPQGSIPARAKSTVRIAFFTIAALHVMFIGGLLMQGCKKSENKPEEVTATETNSPTLPPFDGTTPGDTSVPPINANSAIEATTPPVDVSPPVAPPSVAPAREYVVMKNDTFSTIARKMGVSVKAVEQANPGVNPSKLQIGQKLQIPEPSVGTAPTTSTNSGSTSNGDGTIYTVKSGDMLERIAKNHGTTATAIMRLNNLKNTMIKPGQKLKMPTTTSIAPTGTTAPIP